ncbi:hypothetical protein MIND_01353800 [Mycena indigotica]|uniref:WD40 repeat-like protein n=1 Tax=Mycena indigotica TaxID=2126181 RepID=A0A8H6S0I1_9AGAR|nr:uncharacterized protein MIND_01353800 [Mycena indigotica]KAF7289796.1 hypothetical protein MIND_01353800 [Mycena indigotica]
MEVDYRLNFKLSGHSGAIISLSVRHDGKFLASGGSDGTKVWELSGRRAVSVPASPDLRGATTSLLWIKREDDIGEALVIGTHAGYVAGWREETSGMTFTEMWARQLSEPMEITGLAFDAPTNRLGVCHRGGVLQVYTLSAAMVLHEVFSFKIQNCVPRAIGFGSMNGDQRELLLFGLYCGKAYSLNGRHNFDSQQGLEYWIDHVSQDKAAESNGVLCIDDPSSGINLYRLTERELVKSFPMKKTARIRNVAIGDGCSSIVSGSDCGVVYIHDRRSGKLVAELKIEGADWVQTVAAGNVGGVPYIFAAQSRETTVNDILVYHKQPNRRRFLQRVGETFFRLFWAVMAVAGLAFFYQHANITLVDRVVERVLTVV